MDRSPRLASLIGLFVLLLAVYLFAFSGRFHSHDEISMFAVADSLLKLGRPTTNQLIWLAAAARDDGGAQDAYGVGGDLYSKKSPLTSLIELPFLALADGLHGLSQSPADAARPSVAEDPRGGRVQAAALVSPLATAATAVLLAVYVGRLGYRRETAIVVGLVYGLLSPATVFAKFLFSEPPTALLLTAAMLAATGKGAVRPAAVCGLLLGLATTSRYPALALAPLFGLYLVARSEPSPASQSPSVQQPTASGVLPLRRLLDRALAARRVTAFALGLGLPLAGLGAYNWLRFGSPLLTGYGPGERFGENLLLGMAGLLISPGKGLAVYFPVLLLIVVATPLAWRRRPVETVLAWAVLVVHTLVYGGWFAWWGGLVWGPRLLVPAVPLLMPVLAPLIEKAGERRWLWPAMLPVVGAALAVNLVGTLSDFVLAPQPDRGSSPVVWELWRSPILFQAHLVLSGKLDLAWLAPPVDRRSPVLAAGLLALGILLLTDSLRRRPAIAQRIWPSVVLLVVALPIAWVVAMRAERQIADPTGHFTGLLGHLARDSRPGDVLVTNLPLHTEWLLDHDRLRLASFGLAKNTLDADRRPEQLLSRAIAGSRRVWLPIEGTDRGDVSSGVERWLSERAYRLEDTWFGQEIRLVEYQPGTGLQVLAAGTAHYRLGDAIDLAGFRVDLLEGQGATVDGEARWLVPGNRIGVTLEWRAVAPIDRALKVFIHLGNDAGVLTQHDAMPVDGLRPTHRWQSGDVVLHRATLVLPLVIPPGRYELTVGLYDPATGQRLPVEGGADAVRLAVVRDGGPGVPQ